MQLQQFVTETIENLGGVVMPVEYALCHVLIPEAYAPYFQNKTEMELSFDFEVAQENPQSEFVTFGSYVLEQLLAIVHQQAKTAVRYAVVDRLELGNPEKKIAAFLQDEHGKLELKAERAVYGVWAVFHYHVAILADERIESTEQIWMNMVTNDVDMVMNQEQNRIMYQSDAPVSYPIPVALDMEAAFQNATLTIKKKSEQQKREQINDREIGKDIERINHYYAALIAENDKRINRKGLSEEKRQEIISKTETIKLERDKQLHEIYNKANGEVEISLDNAILYFVPLLEYTVDRHFRGNSEQLMLYYNPITKGFFRV
ncbi:hypothetical protein WMZ97_07050 [Lentibacillus sp. N15]|uniref:hypothetical protein n=1 Tax=Lentibacillus songyuanensis TaxID=3136161 RepID=UPI0031BB1A18